MRGTRLACWLAVAMMACGGDLAGGAGDCTAAGLDPRLPRQDGLSEAAAAMRDSIAAAAVACDYARLGRLALAGGTEFTASFGGGSGDPGADWAKLEAAGEGPLGTLVRILATPYARDIEAPGPELYVWPAVFVAEPTEEDWRALAAVYTPEEIASYREHGYLDWRVGITAEGDWLFFVAGD